jgi:hypothetical protein
MEPLMFQEPERFNALACVGIAAIAAPASNTANGKAIAFISVPLCSAPQRALL